MGKKKESRQRTGNKHERGRKEGWRHISRRRMKQVPRGTPNEFSSSKTVIFFLTDGPTDETTD